MNNGPDGPAATEPGMLELAAPTPAPPPPSAASEPVPRAVPRALQESLPRYPFGVVHSPLTTSVARQVREVARRYPERKADRFSKIGDSITRSSKFLTCLADVEPDALEGRQQSTLLDLQASPFDSLRRASRAAENGWSAWQPLAGEPPPLLRELGEVQGLFGFVLLGTNDIETSRVTTFARRLVKLVDATLAQGSIPLLSTIPERNDRERSRLMVIRFNAAIRAIAQARRVPLIDLHHALSQLPNEGLSSDGIHPSVLSAAGRVRPCDFGPEGLRHGFNVRNSISLEALARARSVLEADWRPELEPAPPSVVDGRTRVAELPFVEVRPLTSESAELPGCSGVAQGQPALRYELSLPRPAFLEVLALATSAGESLAIELASAAEPARCLAAGTGFTRTSLARGDYRVTVHGKADAAMVGLLLGRSGGS